MTFKFPCPHCGQRVAATDELVGSSVACPTCAETFVVRSPAELPAVVMASDGQGALSADNRRRSHYWAILGTVFALTISGGAFFWINHKPIQKDPYSAPRIQRTEVNVAPEGIPETASSRASLIPGLPGPPETVPPPSNSIPGLSDVPGLPAPPSSLESVAPTGGNAGAAIIFPKPESTDAALQAKLNTIIIPRTDFRDATLIECVDFLNYRSKEFDPQRVGVNVIIAPSIPSSTTGLRLTLRLDNVPQMEILNYVAYLCGVKFRIDASGVTLLPKDATKSVEWFQKAAAQGNPEAQCSLGCMYRDGTGVPANAAKAVEWFQKAAAQGEANAQCNLGYMYDSGQGVPKDDAKAFEWYRKAAAQGNAMAQYNLGVAYSLGQGVPKDGTKAFEWSQKAAAQGNARAQFNLGFMYANGEGVTIDVAKALEWYQTAAAQGNATAQNELGLIYLEGKGVPKDDTRAFEWYRMAAGQGNAWAQYNLAFMYASGKGVPKDDMKSFEWCQKAAAQGNASAQYNLGVSYASGKGVRKDDTKAFEWFQKAAAQGSPEAKEWVRNYLAASQPKPSSK